jgi:hypothetical protein
LSEHTKQSNCSYTALPRVHKTIESSIGNYELAQVVPVTTEQRRKDGGRGGNYELAQVVPVTTEQRRKDGGRGGNYELAQVVPVTIEQRRKDGGRGGLRPS